MAADSQPLMTCVAAKSKEIPEGEYPFAVYQWQYHGIRADAEFRPVSVEPALNNQLLSIIQGGEPCSSPSEPVTAATKDQIERQHYRLWSDARAQHVEQTKRIADFRLASLRTSHNARMAILENQLAQAENDRIRIMRTAQKANAKADYERHLHQIEEAVNKADITAEPIAWGIIRIGR
jgi:hypothetical protein